MRIRIIIILSFLTLTLSAIPVKREYQMFTQPDGTTFMAQVRGNAFMKLVTTLDGCAIVKGEDGYWRYGAFDAQGFRYGTSYRVGDEDVPAEILSGSRSIPLELIARNSRKTRQPINFDGRPNLERRIHAAHPVMTKGEGAMERHGLVILAQFTDVKFSSETPQQDFDKLLNENSSKSAIAYFNDQFNGRYDFKFTVAGPVTVSKNMAYYGKNGSDDMDMHPEEMVKEACELADSEVDFSLYDDDGDGEVDNVFIFFAGKDEADDADNNADCIWSHAYYIYSGTAQIKLILDGKRIDRYACSSELMGRYEGSLKYTMASIGTFCHEYTHTFDLPDFYDSDYALSGGTAEALWYSLDLMDGGNMNNDGYTPPYYSALERVELDIADVTELTPGTHTLEPVHLGGKCFKVSGDYDGEYYLLECRHNTGWDTYIGGSGLLIYHIDKSDRRTGMSESYQKNLTAYDRWFTYNEANARPDHQCADLVEADPSAGHANAQQTYNNRSKVFWPQKGHTQFTATSNPPFVFWSGKEAPLSIVSITKDGNSVVLVVEGATGEKAPDVVYGTHVTFQDAAIISWSSSDETYEEDGFISFTIDGKTTEYSVAPYEPGKYAFVMEGLTPRTAYSAEIYFKAGSVKGNVDTSCKFTTRSVYSDTYPYIILSTAKKSGTTFVANTTIPLRVCNATEAEGIVWRFDGEKITVGKDGYWHPEKSGVLKAEISYKDGSKDIIIRKLTVK